MDPILYPAIPSASKTNSGVITTGEQEFSGDKVLDGIFTAFGVKATNINPPNEDENLYIGFNVGTGTIYIGADGDYNFGSGGEYTGNAATATKVKNKLIFTGAVTGEYNGSKEVTVNIPISELSQSTSEDSSLVVTGGQLIRYTGSSSISSVTLSNFSEKNAIAVLIVPADLSLDFTSESGTIKKSEDPIGTSDQIKAYAVQYIIGDLLLINSNIYK